MCRAFVREPVSEGSSAGMAIQPAIAVGLSGFCVLLAVSAILRRFLGRWGWVVANALVILGASLSLVFARQWAGAITAALFALLLVCPFALLLQAKAATQRGQWRKAARLQRWAVLLHPTAWTRFGLALSRARSADPQQGYQAALAHIEATGTQKQMAFARLLLAQERRDWQALLSLARAGSVEFSEAKPREIRALGELGRLEEMVHTYRSAERRLLLAKRDECLLFVCAFAGRLAGVQHLLSRPRFAVDEELKTYWMAVSRIRADRQDKLARATLRELGETSREVRVRRSAAAELERADRAAPLPGLAQETQRQIDILLDAVGQNRPPRLKWSTKAHVRGLFLLILVILIATLQRYYR
jgi:hypothetical protein